MNFKQIHPDFGHHNTEGGRTEQLLLFFFFGLTSNINDYLLLLMFFFLTLYQLLAGYQTREQAIKRCINAVNENTQQLRERRDKNPDDYYAMRDLRKEQTKVRIVVHHFTRMQQLIYKLLL